MLFTICLHVPFSVEFGVGTITVRVAVELLMYGATPLGDPVCNKHEYVCLFIDASTL